LFSIDFLISFVAQVAQEVDLVRVNVFKLAEDEAQVGWEHFGAVILVLVVLILTLAFWGCFFGCPFSFRSCAVFTFFYRVFLVFGDGVRVSAAHLRPWH
jgi:hypothetical protein